MARIIYVEDDDLISTVVRDILSTAGHLIGVIAHGTLGFETIAFKKPDLVILDLMLPGMDGIEVIRQLRRIPATYLTPILILTASRDEAASDAALGAGANDFMTKPFSADALIERVDLVLRQNPFTPGAKAAFDTQVAMAEAGSATGT